MKIFRPRCWLCVITALLAQFVLGAVTHFVYPIPNRPQARQIIECKTYEFNQTKARKFAWGISGRFSGIDPMVALSHHKYGIEIKFIFADGSYDWFAPTQKFTARNAGWQHLSGVYQPRKPIQKAIFYYRLATAGEAWYDGVTLFELPEEAIYEKCRIVENDGAYTLENEFLSVTLSAPEGATITSLIDRKTGTNYSAENINRRMLLDKFRQGGACYDKVWKAEVKKSTEDEVSLEVKVNGPPGYPYLDVSKVISLKRDSAALNVAYSWYNQPASMGDLVIEPWVVNGICPRGGVNQRVMYPTAKGISAVGPSGGVLKHKDVIGGWYATCADDRRSMAMTFDWSHYAETWHYLAGNDNLVTDLILQPVKIAAGGTFSTEYEFFPLQKVKKPSCIENGLATEFIEKGDALTVLVDGTVQGVCNAVLVGAYADGHKEYVRESIYISPECSTQLKDKLALQGLQTAAIRLYAAGTLAFESDYARMKDYVYKPKKAKAKPAQVKPFSLDLKRDIVTPHTKFASPWAGGKPRVLFLTSIHQAREIVELMQRADIEARTVRLTADENTTTWAMIERFNSYKFFDMNVSLKQELSAKLDAIVISGDLFNPIDKENKALIEKHLAAGTGLIRIGVKNPKIDSNQDAVNWIVGNVSASLLLDGVAKKVRAADLGSHREVMLDYEGRMGLTPFTGYQRKQKVYFRYQDYLLSVVARSIYWASKRDVKVPEDVNKVEEVISAGPGLNIRHTFWKGEAGVYDWRAEAIPLKKSANITQFTVNGDDFRVGDKIEGVIKTSNGAATVELFDGYGRLLSKMEKVNDHYALMIPEAKTGLLTIKASVFCEGKLADEVEKDVVCRIPYHRSEFPLCLSEGWVTYAYEKEYLLQHRAKIYQDLGINFIRFWDSSRTSSYLHMLRYGFDLDFSIYDARFAVHSDHFNRKYLDPYSKTHDKKYLVREPCLHDPAYRAKLDAKTTENVRRIAKFSPVTCDCGDENTLTRWTIPFDFCFSEHTLKAFREWLKSEYGSLAKLNVAWGTNYEAWDLVVPDTTIESQERAKRTGVKSYAAWADHRRFMELTFCETIERVGKILDKELPGVPLDMSGTQAPNGWTGMDMWLISKSVREPAAYEEGLLGDYIRSFGRPFIKPWTGYGVQPKTLEVWPWFVAFKFLDAGLYFWTCFNFLLPDYSPTPSAIQYGKAGDELKSGAARLLRSLEYRHQVLLHYSYGSIHAAQIENRGDAFDKCSLKWTQELQSRGVPYRFVAYEEIETGELERTSARVLILPQSAAISDKEAVAIRNFAKRGGVVVGDDFTGLMDEHCALRSKPVLRDIIVRDLKLGSKVTDGISSYVLYGRNGANGRYWGFTRDEQVGEGVAKRIIKLNEPAYVYDLRDKRELGKVKEFAVAMSAAQAKFFAALPYKVGNLTSEIQDVIRGSEGKVTIKVDVPRDALDCHPVLIEVYDPNGKKSRLYSGVCDAKGGLGEYGFRTALNDIVGVWRVVAIDYITGKTSAAFFNMKE